MIFMMKREDDQDHDLGADSESLHQQLKEHIQRLQALKAQQALHGNNAPPELLREISAVTEAIAQQRTILEGMGISVEMDNWVPPPATLSQPAVPANFATELQQLFQQASHENRGQLAFLTGSQYSGRYALSQQVMDQARNTGITTLDLTFQKAYDGQRLLLHQQSSRPGVTIEPNPQIFNKSLREFIQEKTLIINVRNIEVAYPVWWPAFEKLVFPELGQGWPVLMMIHLTTRSPLEDIYKRLDQTDTSLLASTARLWANEDNPWIDDFFCGDPLEKADITSLIGVSASDVVTSLYEEAEGDPRFTVAIWEAWQAEQQVVKDNAGRWQFATGLTTEKIQTHLMAEALLSELMVDDSGFDIDEVREILSCAALEGEVFTAEAIAAVLEWETDDLIDFFDEVLCCLDEGGQLRPNETPLLLEARPELSVNLPRYRFASPLLYHYWAKQISDDQPVAWGKPLAEELARLYAPNVSNLMTTIIDLFEQAGDNERADSYRQSWAVSPDVDTLRWLVELYQSDWSNEPQNLALSDRKQLFDVAITLTRYLTTQPQQWQEGLTLAALSRDVVETMEDPQREGLAWYALGLHQHNLRRFDEALQSYKRAYQLSEQTGNQSGVAIIHHKLGDIYIQQNAFQEALRQYLTAYQLYTQLNSSEFIGQISQAIGQIYLYQKNYDEALAWCLQGWNDKAPSHTLNKTTIATDIGTIYYAKKEYDQALSWYQQAEALQEREYHPLIKGRLFYQIGLLYKETNVWPTVVSYLEQAHALLQEGNDTPEMIQSLMDDLTAARQHAENQG
ncbi:MAG: tetratricopeptide repeat protein [Chloroflexota bacterium]